MRPKICNTIFQNLIIVVKFVTILILDIIDLGFYGYNFQIKLNMLRSGSVFRTH